MPGNLPVLIVARCANVRYDLVDLLETHGYHTETAASVSEAIRLLRHMEPFRLVIVQDGLQTSYDGLSLALELHARGQLVLVVSLEIPEAVAIASNTNCSGLTFARSGHTLEIISAIRKLLGE